MSLAEEYAKVLVEAQDTESELVSLLRTRQHASREQKLAKSEAEAAAKYAELQEELEGLNAERDLVALWHMDREKREVAEELSKARAALEDAQEAAQGVNKRADDAAVAAAKAKREVLAASRAADEAIRTNREATRTRERLEAQAGFLEEKEDGLRARLAEIAEKKKQKVVMLKNLKQEIAKMEKDEAKMVKTWDAGKTRRDEEDVLVSDYHAALQRAETATAGARARAAKLNGEVAAAENEVAVCRSKVSVLESTVSSREKRLAAISEQLSSTETRVAEANEGLSAETKELEDLERQYANREEEKKSLEEELRELHSILSRYEGDKAKGAEQQRVLGALGGLVSSGDIIGKMRALTEPTEPRFETAIRAGLGRHNDALIVRDGDAARRALDALREQKAGTATFIPLDVRVRLQEIDRVRKALPSGYWMLCDLVKVQGGEGEKRAVAWACGCTVVATTMDAAREIAFGRAGAEARGDSDSRLKVVCLDGSVIHQSGAMSAGNVPSRTRASMGGPAASAAQRGKRKAREDVSTDGAGLGAVGGAEEVVLTASEVSAARNRKEEVSSRLSQLGGGGEAIHAALMQMRTRYVIKLIYIPFHPVIWHIYLISSDTPTRLAHVPVPTLIHPQPSQIYHLSSLSPQNRRCPRARASVGTHRLCPLS